MNRRFQKWLKTILPLVAALAVQYVSALEPGKKPNIVVVMADDVGM